ncbi:MAG: Swt1 family HEPN domain-containing protein [Promethearchaeota archaeon]
MTKIIKTNIIKKIEAIFNEYNDLKATFKPLKYSSMLGKDPDEIARINGLITKIKIIILRNFSEKSPIYKQVELHSKGKDGKCGRDDLKLLISDLNILYEEIIQKKDSIEESKQMTLCVKKLFALLKKYRMYEFLSTDEFTDTLMELDLDDYWEEELHELKENIANNIELIHIDPIKETFIGLLEKTFKESKKDFVRLVDHIVSALLSHFNINDFKSNGFKNLILNCGFNSEDINKMQCIESKDLSEMIDQIPKIDVLPEGVNYQKYDEIFEQLKLPSAAFQYIFACENILRKFIVQILNDNGYPSIESIENIKLTKLIQDRKNQEARQNYLPIRGDHDIYYLDLIELKRIITHEWKDCFADKFDDQTWILARIDSLYSIRNRVAHSSSLTSDELKSVETYCREIIKQIDPHIK